MSDQDDRATHLAKHFRAGNTMAEWSGGWGFDPEVATHVADAMPPFMIEPERTKPIPWSATTGDKDLYTNLREEHGRGPQASVAQGWEVLGCVLLDYVAECRQRGEEVTDAKLQKHARLCLYGTDDTWDQTRADDPQWLALFKVRAGIANAQAGFNTLSGSAAAGGTQAQNLPFLAADLGFRSAPGLSAEKHSVLPLTNTAGPAIAPASSGINTDFIDTTAFNSMGDWPDPMALGQDVGDFNMDDMMWNMDDLVSFDR